MRLGIAAFVLAVSSAAVMAQTKVPAPPTPVKQAAAGAMDKAAIEKALIANETKVNDAFGKNDAATFKALVDPAGMAMDESGLMPVSEFVKLLEGGQAKVTGQKLEDFKVQWVDANTAVLTYKWSGKGTMAGQPMKSPTYASTVWTKKGDKWLAVFHHETPAMPMPPTAKK